MGTMSAEDWDNLQASKRRLEPRYGHRTAAEISGADVAMTDRTADSQMDHANSYDAQHIEFADDKP